MLKQPLHDGWTVQPVGDMSEVPAALRDVTVPARVPGCVHTDLLRAVKIPDPYQGRNEFEVRWIGHTDWQYRTTFVADEQLFAHERIDLVFDGLDTVARIELNGHEIARTFNMHRGYRFDVRPQLKRGANDLVVTFSSPVRYAEKMQRELGPRPYCNGPGGPFNFIRKMACNFGWDWGPALPTSGIWRGVWLEGWNRDRIVAVRPIVKSTSDDEWHLDVHVDLVENAKRLDFSVWLDSPGDDVPEPQFTNTSSGICFNFRVPKPRLWWPRGHGDQPTYVFAFNLGRPDDEPHQLEECRRRIGLRTVELDSSPDDIGSKFVVKVNGKPIFCKGFNWIPDDCFLDRATEPNRVRQRIQQAVDAGANMLRVWGGGIYETDDFYDICDEMGVLVWQDFLFACAMYPEEEPFRSEVEAEARYNVSRLAHHPSLALWNGCNENMWAYRDWGWKDQLNDPAGGKRSWGLNYYLDLLPRVCRELTPTVPYWAASPWSGDPDAHHGVHPNADTHGNMHVWKPWFHEDYESYREFQARFCSEFGFQAPATYASIASVVPEASRDFGGVEMRHRQKSGDRVRDDGDRRNLRHLIAHFNLPGAQELYDALEPPEKGRKLPDCGCEPVHPAKSLPSKVDFDDLHYLLQVNQARALTLGVEWFRSRQPRCMGTLYWQLNDCWPGATSWSCIDGDGRKKPLWYATRRFFAPRLLTIQPAASIYRAGEPLWLHVLNDTDERWRATGRAWLQDMRYRSFLSEPTSVNVDVQPRSVAAVPLHESITQPRYAGEMDLIVAEVSGLRTYWYFQADKNLDYPSPRYRDDLFTSELARGGARHVLTVTAGTLLRDICIFADRLDPAATVNEQLVTLLPHESFTFEIDSKVPLTREQLTSSPVFRFVNSFGKDDL